MGPDAAFAVVVTAPPAAVPDALVVAPAADVAGAVTGDAFEEPESPQLASANAVHNTTENPSRRRALPIGRTLMAPPMWLLPTEGSGNRALAPRSLGEPPDIQGSCSGRQLRARHRRLTVLGIVQKSLRNSPRRRRTATWSVS